MKTFRDQVKHQQDTTDQLTPFVPTNAAIPYVIQDALRRIATVAHAANQNAQNIIAANPITPADTVQFGHEAIHLQLQVEGKSPLNVSGLIGVLAQPQKSGTSGPLSELPKGLGAGDKGAYYDALDVEHRFVWDGNGWDFAPGDPGSGWGTFSVTMPQQGDETRWVSVPAGGGNVTCTKHDGTTVSVTFGSYTPPGTGYLLWVRL